MTTPGAPRPDGAFVLGTTYGSDLTETTAKQIMKGGTIGSFTNAQNAHNSQVKNPIVAIDAIVTGHGQQLADLEGISGTGIETPIWASTGGKDMVSFPRVLMQPIPANNTANTNLGQHRHQRDGAGSFTGYENLGSHNHSVNMIPPAFTQQSSSNGTGTVDYVALRGAFRADPVPLNILKIITGGDNSLFGIDAWYLAIQAYNPSTESLQTLWSSGDLKGTLASQRQGYNIATGLTYSADPDHLIFVSSLQIAPGLFQPARGLGCIFQTGIAEPAGTVPSASAYKLPGQTSIPTTVGISSLTPNRDYLMWAALGPTP